MAKCEMCGKIFDPDEAYFDFNNVMFSYDNFRRTLCADCANEVIEDGIEGEYFETCESCGKEFDYFEQNSCFNNFVSSDMDLCDVWNSQILCIDCAQTVLDNDDKDDEQNEIVVKLCCEVETLGEDEFQELYNQLDYEHQSEVDESIRKWSDACIGDEHWDSDN